MLEAHAGLTAHQNQEEEPLSLGDALREGKVALQLRYRYERVDDDRFARLGLASTLRTALSYASKPYRGFKFFLQVENVADIGADDLHANRGAGERDNGVRDRPVVADPPGTSLLQGYAEYDSGVTSLRLGRQEVTYDDHRFVGNVGWRQHHQSFRALRLIDESVSRLTTNYAYVDRVYRIFGDRLDTAHHLFNLRYELGQTATLTGYAYLLRYDRVALARLSSNTFGAELKGTSKLAGLSVRYEAELATQRDAGDNPDRVRVGYVHLMAGASTAGYGVRVGWERLGGNPQDGRFQTPLATLHAFNGWADKFLSTPVNGLRDLYVRVQGPVGPVRGVVVFHDFRAATGSARYGTELDFQFTYTAPWKQLLGFRGALYDADTFSTDTSKIWLYSTYAF